MKKKLTRKPKNLKLAIQEKETPSEKKLSIDSPNNNILIGLVFIALIVIIFLVRSLNLFGGTNQFKTKIIPEAIKKVLNNSQAKFEISNVKDVSGIYEFELNLNGQKYVSYITKDGEILFTTGIKLKSLNQNAQTQQQQKKLTCNDIQKSEKSMLTAFVVADCPYGLQMQRVLKKAIAEQPELSQSVIVRYIGAIEGNKITSMHGDKEAQENMRQICIREEQKEKYWPYVSCYMQEGKSDDCLIANGINKADIDTCATDQNRGLKYAKVDFDLANKNSVGGSPTLLINEKQTVSEFDFGGRNPNAIKEVICCGSKNKAEFCSKAISKNEVAVSLSKTDEAATGTQTSGAAGCATQ